MTRKLMLGFLGTALALILLSVSLCVAQQTAAPPAAPIPTQISSAKKVFVSNAGGEELDPQTFFLPTLRPASPYDKFYAALKSAGRYETVLAPGDADLILEIRFRHLLIPGDDHVVSNSSKPHLRLNVLDPRTHILLWAFAVPVEDSAGPHWKEKREKNFDRAIATLLDDFTKLASQSATLTGGDAVK